MLPPQEDANFRHAMALAGIAISEECRTDFAHKSPSRASAAHEINAQASDCNAASIKRKPNPGSPLMNHSPKRARLRGTTYTTEPSFSQDGHRATASRLPTEIWHRILTFVPPQTLGRMMLVNKLFKSYLDPSPEIALDNPSCSSTSQVLPRLKPDLIW